MDILKKLQCFDVQLFTWLASSIRGPGVLSFTKALSKSGDGYLHIAIPVLLFTLSANHLSQFCLTLTLAITCERALYWVLKNSLKRRRPQEFEPSFRSLITPSDQFSFPSGHSSAAFLLATVLAVTYPGPVFVLYLWAIGVAVSRVLLGVHFPGDAIAGAIMGTTVALATASLLGVG
ncbi:MAG: undecaprenyl-diphosphatase [Halioglobus sp.]|jgi:undecaprenyl-diphosphatase